MKKYFVADPSSFVFYNGVDRNGDLHYELYRDFKMSDPFYNKLFFETTSGVYDGMTVKEIITGEKYTIRNDEHSRRRGSICIEGKNLYIISDGLLLKEIEASSTQAAGFFKSMKNNQALSEEYTDRVLQFTAIARATTYDYNRDINGIDKPTSRKFKKLGKML